MKMLVVIISRVWLIKYKWLGANTFLLRVLLLNLFIHFLKLLERFDDCETSDKILSAVSNRFHHRSRLNCRRWPPSTMIDPIKGSSFNPRTMKLWPMAQNETSITYPGLKVSVKTRWSSIQRQANSAHPFSAHYADFKVCDHRALPAALPKNELIDERNRKLDQYPRF